MSFLEPVRGLVWEIVAGAVVSYAVPWLSEFVQRTVPPLWEKYWPLFYQSILVPAFHLVSDTFTNLVRDRLSNRGENASAESVSESPPTLPQGGTMLPDQNTLDRPPDPVPHAVTNISNGPPSDHEDIPGTSVSDHRALLEGGTMESPHDRNILVRPSDDTVSHSVASISSSLSSDDEDITVTSGSEPHTLLEGGKVESPLDQNILAPLDSVLHTATNISGGLPLDHEEMTVTSVSEPHTLLEGVAVESPLDQNILVQASDSISNSSSDISSDHDDTTVISVSNSATVTEGGTPASVDVDFFGEYSEGSRYRIEEVIGNGSHGLICSAYDTHLGEKVAIKKINDIFKHVSDATRILREIKLLRLLRHPDIVEIKHILLPPSIREFKDIYVVFELMECDLRAIIKANDDMTPEHCRFFLYQLLRGLKYIHTANVFHRDLNPKNVLAIADCKLKIRHFSHAFIDIPTAIFWTDYVAARWYKAPELCGQFFSKYSPAVDIWSIGCIFAELLSGKPLFPGENTVHQLDLITDLLGTPSPEAIAKIRNEKARTSMSSMQKKKPIPFSKKFPNADPVALRLLERMLAFDPEHRPSAEEALANPYFKDLARVEREFSAHPVAEEEFEFERLDVTKEDLRELIYREILENYPQTSKKLEHFEHYPQMSKKHEFFLEAAETYATMHSFSHSKTKRLLAKVASMTPKKLLHHPS